MLDLQEEQPEPFKVTPGFIAFVAAMCLPLLAAVVIYIGAAVVAGDVREAESVAGSSFDGRDTAEVEDWKQTLVGICPLH